MTSSPDNNDISSWLEQIGLSRYQALFRANEIDMEVLPDLTNEDYRELEIPIGDRKKLQRAIALLAGAAEPSATTAVAAGAGIDASEAEVERRQITVLFCDLAGSTELSNRLDIEDLASALRDFQQTCADIVERGGGFVARYQGDAMLAYFGWPRAHEDDAERCVRTGLEMVQAVGQIRAADDSSLAARVGIATGLVMVGELIGEGLSQEKAVVGATPNLAARLESLAQPGSVAISATTARLIGDLFKLNNLGAHRLKGFPDPEQVWGVESAREITSRFGVRLRKGLTPLVGRKREAEAFRELWSKTVEGQGQVAVVVGEAGIGKSRMIRSLDSVHSDGNHVWEWYQCHAFHVNSALHPFIEQFNQKAKIHAGDTPDIKLKKLENWLSGMGLASRESVPLLASLLSISWEGYYPPLDLSPQMQGQKVIDLVVEVVTWTRSTTPLVLVFEDIHWADPTTLQVIARVASQIASRTIMMVVTHRPDFETGWSDALHASVMNLGRLSSRQVKAMVNRIAGNKLIPDDVLESITSATDGIPLFVEELTKTILESGQLVEESDHYQVESGRLEIEIPASLRDSLAARLDQLTVGRELAQVGATIGRQFSAQLAAYILRVSDIELREPITHLSEAGIIERRGSPRQGQYFFKHALFQEVAYQSQLKTKRRQVHLKVAEALETHFPEVAQGQPEVLARHFEQAGSVPMAADYLRQAGSRSLQVAATGEAIAHLAHGLELMLAQPRSTKRDLAVLRFHASLGTAYMLAKGWAAPEVEQAYTEANKVSYAATDAAEAIWILWGIWVYRHVRGQISESIPISGQIAETAAQHSDPGLQVVADMVLLQVNFYAGQFEMAIQHCQSLEREFDQERDREFLALYSTDLELVALVHYSLACWISGEFDQARQLARGAEELARGLGHTYSTSWMLLWGATPWLLEQDLEELARRLKEGLAIAEEHGYAYAVSMGAIYGGWLKGQQGDLEGGIKQMEGGLAAFRSTGAEIAVPFFNTLLADMYRHNGNVTEALGLLDRAQQQAMTWGECWQEPEIHRVRAEALAAGPGADTGAAEESFRRAIDIAKRQDAGAWWLRAALGLARMQLAQGQPAAARATLWPAFDTLEVADSVPDYSAAKALLIQLANLENIQEQRTKGGA